MAQISIEDIRLFPSAGEELRGNCPFCRDTKRHLYINKGKGVYYCHRCGASGKIADLVEAENESELTYRSYQDANTGKKKAADIESLHKAYSALIDTLNLSAEHYKHLIRDRKLTTAQIYKKGYRTLPDNSRIKIASRVSAKTDISGVPGFYKFKGKKWCLAGPEGLLIPVRNFEGKIWGMQIRTNKSKYKTKYCWLSSASSLKNRRPEGTEASSFYHAALTKKPNNKTIWITEGPLKGDIASSIMQENFLCVPGVNSWSKSGIIKDIAAHGIKEAVIAYDADAFCNIYVAKAADKLFKALSDAGIKTFFAVWPIDEGKGIDDMLQNGYEPKIVDHAGFLQLNPQAQYNSSHLL